jgi:uncharacterized protein YxeA
MKKALYYISVAVLFLIFILIMNLSFFKNHLSDTEAYFSLLGNQLQDENWTEAGHRFQELSQSWQQILPVIQFSIEKDEIDALNTSLSRLETYIELHEKNKALVELSEAREHWDNLER